MNSYDEYNNEYALDPPYIDWDAARSINPGIMRQHMSPDARIPPSNQLYQSAGYNQRSNYPVQANVPKVSTYIMEKKIYDISKTSSQLFWMVILIVILVVVTLVINILTLGSIFISGHAGPHTA